MEYSLFLIEGITMKRPRFVGDYASGLRASAGPRMSWQGDQIRNYYPHSPMSPSSQARREVQREVVEM